MRRLFVDCDDTLILWERRSGFVEVITGEYKINTDLIGQVLNFLKHNPDFELVVWSHGGVDYAGDWALQCFGGLVKYTIEPKEPGIAAIGDMVIDDDLNQLSWAASQGAKAYYPHEFWLG